MKNNSFLSCHQKAFILGMLLGDGSLKLYKGYKNARLSFRHSVAQKDGFLGKREQLRNGGLSADKDVGEQQKGSDGSNHKLRYQSKAIPELTELYLLVHKGGDKGALRIGRKGLNMMDAQSLAIGGCDDGSLVSNTRQGVFCTDGFTLRDLKVLVQYLKKVGNISTTIHPVGLNRKDGTPRYRIWLRSRRELEKLLKLIAPHIKVNSMLYKILLLYKDSQLQQRGISELVKLTCFTQTEISQATKERKTTLKAFKKTENDIVHPEKN